jgi:uncharacterized repeat protein (TIGR03803 family)
MKTRLLSATISLFAVFAATAIAAQAQTFTVLHQFTGGRDGANPLAGLSMDPAGRLYGTASLGGIGYGTVFELAHQGSGWILKPLYAFQGIPDGFFPEARVTLAADGTLYGTTFYGGVRGTGCNQGGPLTLQCGTFFHLTPPATACTTVVCPWTETQLYEFNSYPSLFWPNFGDLVFDPAGNLDGVAFQGGNIAGGVFQLTPSHGGWTETAIYDFKDNGDGDQPVGGVIVDTAGNLYGTTLGAPANPQGRNPYGTVYELTPSGSGWTEHTLHVFQDGSDGALPRCDLIEDASGNLYGTTSVGGSGGGGTAFGGTVFELTPSQGDWVFTVLYSFPGPGKGPFSPLLMDATGNLYGTTLGGGAHQQGSVFKLTHSNGNWTYTSLHDFTGGSDGRALYGHLLLDANGNLYGTAGWGGTTGNGVVWEITP